MGILNVTPDSFSDGGLYLDPEAAVRHGEKMAHEGADVIDIGGESSRPGAESVAADEEMRRVLPVIRGLKTRIRAAISVDTSKFEVAKAAIEAGADLINDVTALRGDERLAGLAAESGVGVVLMHMQGDPRTMQVAPHYENLLNEIIEFLLEREAWCLERGIKREQIAFDPGIGFGKTLEHNLEILRGLEAFTALGRPVLLGPSRKAFLRKLLRIDPEDRATDTTERLRTGTAAACAVGVVRGASILRVHDVKPIAEMCRVACALR